MIEHGHRRYIVPIDVVRAAADGTSWVMNVVRPVLQGAELLGHAEIIEDAAGGWAAEVSFATRPGDLEPRTAAVRLRPPTALATPEAVQELRRRAGA